MSFLPIVDRELRVAARSPLTYRNRVLAAGGLAAVAMAMLVLGLILPAPIRPTEAMFAVLSWALFAYCLLEGVRKTADCLSEERRDGTLGLLFLTDLRGYDVVLGKLAATSLPSVYGLFALLPILSLALLLGGVAPAEYWRMALALYDVLFVSLAAGLLVSALCREERQAMGGACLLLGLLIVVPVVLPPGFWTHFSPLRAFRLAFDDNYRRSGAGDYYRALAATQGLAWLFLAAAAGLVTRFRQGDADARVRSSKWAARWERWRFGSPRKRAARRTRLLEISPITWLVCRDQGVGVLLWLLAGVMLAAAVTMALAAGWDGVGAPSTLGYLMSFVWLSMAVNFLVKMRLGAMACHLLARSRAEGTLELLLCTPLKLNDLVRGQVSAFYRNFAAPLAVLLAAEALGIVGMAVVVSGGRWDATSGTLSVVAAALYAAIFVLDVRALVWVGMWFGLSSQRESQAVFKTIGAVLLLPLVFVVTFFFMIFYPLAGLIWPLICQAMAMQKLQYHFRRLAGQRFLTPAVPTSGNNGSWTWKRTYTRLPPLLADSGGIAEGRLEEPTVFGAPPPPPARKQPAETPRIPPPVA